MRSKFEKFKCLFSRLAFENIEVLHHELVLLGPPDPETLLILIESRLSLSECCKPSNTAGVKKIKDFFVIYLQKRAEDTDVLSFLLFSALLDLFKELHDTSLRYTCWLNIWRRVFVIPSFHRECFSTTRLPIGKYGCVIALHNFIYQAGNAKTVIDIVLTMLRCENLIKVV